MKIVFMGTPDIAKESLQALYENKHEIIGVVTTPDKPSGRGMKLVYSPVKEYAISKNLEIYQPEKVRKNEEFIEKIRNLNPDVICVVAYGKILPDELLNIPRYGAINVHPSLLPKYRGAAPIQWAVLNGDKITGVTTMYMDSGMDTGDIILKEETIIGDNETTGELWDRLSTIGAKLLVETLNQIDKKTVVRINQTGETCLAPMLDKQMGKINWEDKSAKEIHNLVRGLNPFMGAYTYVNEKKIKFWKVRVVTQEELFEIFPDMKEYSYKLKLVIPGTILISDSKKGLYIKAKDDIIEVLEIQGENAKKMGIQDFLRGEQIDIGTIAK